MGNQRLRFLVEEYRLAEKRLNDIQADYIKLKTSAEVIEELKKDFNTEIRRANESGGPELARQWEKLRDQYIDLDKDRPDPECIIKAENLISSKNKELILYYQRKLKVIKRLIGTRESELLDSLEEKSILIGEENPSGKLLRDSEDKEKEAKLKEKNKNVNFDKM